MNEADPTGAEVAERPWPSDVPKGPLNEEDRGVLGTVNTDGDVTSYPVTEDVAKNGLPEVVRKKRASRAKVPKGWVLRAKRKDGKSEAYWLSLAEEIIDKTGLAPVPQPVFEQAVAGKFAMFKSYTTLDRIEMAIRICEEKLQNKDLTEDLQIEWMNCYRGMLAMQKEYLEELKDSAKLADTKTKNDNKPRNLPPAFVLQQNFNGAKPVPAETKVIDEPKAIGDS